MHNIDTECCELDAMPPPELRERIAEAILERMDHAAAERALEVEQVKVQAIETFGNSLQASISGESR